MSGISAHRWCFGNRTKAPFRGRCSVPRISRRKKGASAILAVNLVVQKIQSLLITIAARAMKPSPAIPSLPSPAPSHVWGHLRKEYRAMHYSTFRAFVIMYGWNRRVTSTLGGYAKKPIRHLFLWHGPGWNRSNQGEI